MIKNMEIIKVLVGWEDKNYSAVAECNGVVVATHKDFEMLKKEFTEAFAFHINESAKDGDPISPALLNGDYDIINGNEVINSINLEVQFIDI